MQHRMAAGFLAVALVALVAACSGGGGGGGYGGPTTTPTSTNTSTPLSTQQVVRLSLPTTAIGTVNDPSYGTVGGYTQTIYSQVLAFAPGSQIMIQNAQTVNPTPHTLGDLGGSFNSGSTLSTTASSGSTFSSGFQSGTINAGAAVGPFTLAAGTYYIGCAFHYASNQMRDVLVVSAAATPGPQGTQPPTSATPQPIPSSNGGGYGY